MRGGYRKVEVFRCLGTIGICGVIVREMNIKFVIMILTVHGSSSDVSSRNANQEY